MLASVLVSRFPVALVVINKMKLPSNPRSLAHIYCPACYFFAEYPLLVTLPRYLTLKFTI